VGIAPHPASELHCAQTRKQAQRLFTVLVRVERISTKMVICRSQETRKAREDTMPHERGPLPVLPSEFFCLLSPIPKLASAARSPATRTVNGNPTSRSSKPLTKRHLSTTRYPLPEDLALPRLADACVPIHNPEDAPAKNPPIP